MDRYKIEEPQMSQKYGVYLSEFGLTCLIW